MLYRSILRPGLASACLLVLSTGCFSTAPVSGEEEEQGLRSDAARCAIPEDADRLADQVLQLVNLERAEEGLHPVMIAPKLSMIADDYACSMIEEQFFGHRHPITDHGPGERAIAGKYSFFSIGENLAAGQETPAEVMRVWMESPTHREIILEPRWKEIGIAVRTGGEYAIYWVQEFGDPADF